MAIQISGTTVIDNSRNLTNIGSATLSGTVTATGNVSGAYFIGNGSGLTGLASGGPSNAKAYFLSNS